MTTTLAQWLAAQPVDAKLASVVATMADASAEIAGVLRLAPISGQTGLAGHTKNSITELSRLERELSLVRSRGYARDNEELEMGVRCMAAGIHDDSGKLVAGLSISAPADRLQEDWLEDLVQTAASISSTLGYRPTPAV